MKIKLLQQHANYKAGAEWNCPWAAVARKLIEEGKALALETVDLHLNPAPESTEGKAEAAEKPTPAAPKPARKKK